MAQVLILSDATSAGIGNSRYIGPYVLASRLEENGFDTCVVDHFTFLENFFESIAPVLGPETLFVGVSTTFLTSYKDSNPLTRSESSSVYYKPFLWCRSEDELRSWFEKLKSLLLERAPRAKIILGGTKAKEALARSEDLFRCVDYFGISSSDESIVELARALSSGGFPSVLGKEGRSAKVLNNIEHIKNRRCPETIFTPKFSIRPGESLPIEISRGCQFNCRFCYYDKRESARKDIDVLKREFLRNFEFFGTTVYHFCDDCFNDSARKVEDICNMILGLPFKMEWVSYARPDMGMKQPHLIDLMIESGARGLYFGIESFNQEAAFKAGKAITPDRIKEFLLSLKQKHRHRCLFEGSFIVGLPGETPESVRETAQWLVENRALDFVSVGLLGITPYNEKIDRVMVDYSDYSRDPKKFGFEELRFSPDLYWRHQTMDRPQAEILTREFQDTWRAAGYQTFLTSIWRYPLLRSLGYQWDDIQEMARQQNAKVSYAEVSERVRAHIRAYHQDLLNPRIGLSSEPQKAVSSEYSSPNLP